MCVCDPLYLYPFFYYFVRIENSAYLQLIKPDNLLQAWLEFRKGKCRRVDVQRFERDLADHLDNLYQSLSDKTYQHGQYYEFYVQDPKQRHIHKAQVEDRVVHHLLYNYLYSVFDKIFIYDSYSCRLSKGTHKGIERLEKFTRIISKNYTRDCWTLKLDIKKFFANVNHKILLELLKRKIIDSNILWLLFQIIDSFHSEFGADKGIPLG